MSTMRVLPTLRIMGWEMDLPNQNGVGWRKIPIALKCPLLQGKMSVNTDYKQLGAVTVITASIPLSPIC